MCGDTFFFYSACFTNRCDKTVTLIFYFSFVGDETFSPTDKPLFARSLPLLLLYNMNIILLYTIHYPIVIVCWGKGSIFPMIFFFAGSLIICFYFCVFQQR